MPAPVLPDVPAITQTIPYARRSRAAVALALALIAVAATADRARADYGPGAEAASASGNLLGNGDSSSPSISDDGRYVVFATQAGNLLGGPPPGERRTAGIVRRDMLTGTVELVAPPQRVDADGALLSPGATAAASISGDGRYVLFETTLALVATDLNTNRDVYVRDMRRGLTDASAYELVSALDGSDDAPAYGGDGTAGSRGGRQGFALSDDGRRAVFRTEAPSTLPAGAAALAPAQQVFVRLLDERRTLLVTRAAGDATLPGTPVARSAANQSLSPLLSGDGTAVAWIDLDVAAQTTTLSGEPAGAAILWRDVSAGPAAPTRRVAGLSDPDDPACPPGSPFPSGGAAATGPCFGPFAAAEALDSFGSTISGLNISMSDDGRRVLLLTSAQQRPFDERTAGDVVYLADMTAGLPRKQALRRVLRALGGQSVLEATLAGGGTRLAFTSAARQFEGPRTIGALPVGDPTINAYVVDLAQGIVQRVTAGIDATDFRGIAPDPQSGVPKDPALGALALSDDAGAIAFAAADGNLFVGDANNDARDVQVVRGTPGVTIARTALAAPIQPPDDSLASAVGGEALRPLAPLPAIHAVVGYPAVDERGVARMTVRAPAAGRLVATATATPRGRQLRVARTTRRLRRAATVTLRFAPVRAARTAARRAGRLAVRVEVRYVPASGRATTTRRSYTLTRSAAR